MSFLALILKNSYVVDETSSLLYIENRFYVGQLKGKERKGQCLILLKHGFLAQDVLGVVFSFFLCPFLYELETE